MVELVSVSPVGVDKPDVGHERERPLDDREGHAAAAVGQVDEVGKGLTAPFEHVENPAEHNGDDHGMREVPSAN